jgi:hypothetical protein
VENNAGISANALTRATRGCVWTRGNAPESLAPA